MFMVQSGKYSDLVPSNANSPRAALDQISQQVALMSVFLQLKTKHELKVDSSVSGFPHWCKGNFATKLFVAR